MKILIAADVVPRMESEKFFIEKDLQALFGGVYEVVQKSDWVVINLECALTTAEKGIKKFAHYLDCEAHTDVWRELYPTWNQTNEK